MIDVMYGRSIADDDQLLPAMRLLIDRGADLNAESDYGESALSVASHTGRFDAVNLLLEAGAYPSPLGWSPLHRAVALGSIDEVRWLIERGEDLEARDRWDRTPWLLSLQVGDLAKAEILLAAGSNLEARGRCGKTSLIYPLCNGHHAIVQWLLANGVDPNALDDHGGSALIVAAGAGDPESVQMLLDVGANVDHCCCGTAAINAASSMEVVRILTGAGADINDINGDMRTALTRLPRSESIDCTLEDYSQAKHRIFGNANPQPMNFAFWKAMVVYGGCAFHARAQFEPEEALHEAVWCFDRFGKSLNELPDGRVIEIAGEHEDYYDPDFCIYNDVIVHRNDGTFDIFGYPRDVFPPTDFHSATLVGDSIFIIGGLGYQGERKFGMTPVFRLNVHSLAIESVKTSGDPPGWICRHKAHLVHNGIEVAGGKVCTHDGEKERYEDTTNTCVLDLTTLKWSRTSAGHG